MNKRILIFNVNWLGDVLFSTALIRNVRRNFPDSFIACVIPSRCYSVLKGNAHLDEIIIFDEKDRNKSILSKLKFVQFLKKREFDTVYLLHRSFTRALICRLAGIPKRVGYHTPKRSFLLTHSITPPQRDSMHRIDYYLNVIEKAGLRIEDRYLEFFVSDEDQHTVEKFLKKEGVAKQDFLIGLNPGGNWIPKRWPLDYWVELANKITELTEAKIIITGGRENVSDARYIKERMGIKPIISCGILNLKQTAALFKRLDLFISADTGPLHIANAVGTKKIIALFGPTSVDITGPYPVHNAVILSKNVGCKIPCYQVRCKDNKCMKAIAPGEVLGHITAIIGRQ